MSLNKVILIGHLGKDPEIRQTKDGREIANFSVATSDSWTDKRTGERKSKSEWHNIVIFSEGLVKLTKNYIKKGSKLYVEGSLQTRKWTDKNGSDHYTTEIILQGFGSSIQLLDSANYKSIAQKEIEEERNSIKSEIQNESENDTFSEEIPF